MASLTFIVPWRGFLITSPCVFKFRSRRAPYAYIQLGTETNWADSLLNRDKIKGINECMWNQIADSLWVAKNGGKCTVFERRCVYFFVYTRTMCGDRWRELYIGVEKVNGVSINLYQFKSVNWEVWSVNWEEENIIYQRKFESLSFFSLYLR